MLFGEKCCVIGRFNLNLKIKLRNIFSGIKWAGSSRLQNMTIIGASLRQNSSHFDQFGWYSNPWKSKDHFFKEIHFHQRLYVFLGNFSKEPEHSFVMILSWNLKHPLLKWLFQFQLDDSNLHEKWLFHQTSKVVWSSRVLCSKSIHDEHHPSCDDHFVRVARPFKQWRSLALRISVYSP